MSSVFRFTFITVLMHFYAYRMKPRDDLIPNQSQLIDYVDVKNALFVEIWNFI